MFSVLLFSHATIALSNTEEAQIKKDVAHAIAASEVIKIQDAELQNDEKEIEKDVEQAVAIIVEEEVEKAAEEVTVAE